MRRASLKDHRSERISPDLDPASDKHFFGKDYPLDKHAVADKRYVFGHPYPAVQDSSDFDRDYVKDENSDGGKWAAQMEYDTLRSKIRSEKEKLDKLKQKMENQYDDWQRAKAVGESNHDEAAEAKAQVDAAKHAAKEAVKKVNDLEGSSQADGTKTGGATGRAIEDVNKGIDDLQKCKEAVGKAKAKLKKLLKQKADEEVKAKEEKTKKAKGKEAKKSTEDEKKTASERTEKENEKEEEMEKSKQGKKGDAKHKKEEHEGEEETEEEFKKEVDEDSKTVSDVKKDYLKEVEDVKRTERQLEEAAKTLKKFRRPPYIDGNGGVYNAPHSLAAMHTQPNTLMMLLAVLVVGAAEFLPDIK